MKYYLFVLLFASISFANNLRVADLITYKDLDEPCPGKYSGWYLMSKNESEWGTAQVKIFFLVDKGFLKRAANSGVNPTEWANQLGKNFRYFCEKSPTVSVKTAVKQTINFMK